MSRSDAHGALHSLLMNPAACAGSLVHMDPSSRHCPVGNDNHGLMNRLRSSPLISRLVLAWFLCVVGMAGAAPLIHPQALELVCGASGSVKLVVIDQAGDDVASRPQALGPHGLDCSLCLQLQGPTPHVPSVVLPAAVRLQKGPVLALAHWPQWDGTVLPARGPPRFTTV